MPDTPARHATRPSSVTANCAGTQPRFLRQARAGTVSPILAAHRELVAATLGEDEGILAVDGTEAVGMTANRARKLPGGGVHGLLGTRVGGSGGPVAVSVPSLGFGPQPCGAMPTPECRRHPFRT